MKYSRNRKYRDLIAEKEKEMQSKKAPVKEFLKCIKQFFVKK